MAGIPTPMIPKLLWDMIEPVLKEMAVVIAETTRELAQAVNPIEYMKTGLGMAEDTVEAISNADEFIAYIFGIDPETMKALYKGPDMPWPLNWFVLGVTLLSSLGVRGMRASDVLVEKDLQALLSKEGATLPDPQTLIRCAFIAPELVGDVRDLLKRYGYNEDNVDKMFIANYRLQNEQDIRTAWFRGIIDDNGLFERMRELGYTDTRTRELVETWQVLPGPQDLFWMVGKEAFEPETYNRLGLDSEFPEEQVAWLQKQGISEEWARKYWIAHWDQPSIQQGFEMLHRGVIDMTELDILFKTVEIPPYWREKLTKIAYSPYTRVDVRRMHDLGILDDNQLIKSYMDLGYDEEHALNMALFTVRYNQGTQKSLTKAEILKGYRKKALKKEDAVEFLMDLSYSKDHAEYLLAFEDYLEQEEIEELEIKNIQSRFENNLISELKVRERLGQMNLPSARIEALIAKWNITKYEDLKFASRTDLVKFLKFNIIDMDTFRLEMGRLGYSFEVVEWYVKLAEIEIGPKPAA